MTKISVLGAGSWGTALALLLAKNGHDVLLWGRNIAQIEEMQQQRRNPFYLTSFKFPSNLNPTHDLQSACEQAEILLVAVPSDGFKALIQCIQPFAKPLIWATKGLDPSSNQLLHHVIATELNNSIDVALLSGPSFAKEVAQGSPTAVVVASQNKAFADEVIALFANTHFRPYYSDDIVGVEIGGAVKNIMAIAAGICDGLNLGANARTALMTRGLNEITQLGLAMGANAKTFTGLAGMGDLILTCTDNQSRNRRFGLALGKGTPAKEAFAEIGQVVEGAHNVKQVLSLAKQFQVEMPITKHIDKVLEEQLTPQEAVKSLFARKLKTE